MRDRCPACGRANPRWTKPTIVEALQAWAVEHGRPPTTKDWKKGTLEHPSWRTVYFVFGSWPEARKAAGMPGGRSGRGALFWTRERIEEAMLDHLCRFNEWPRFLDWKKAGPGHPCNQTVLERFGSWPEAQRCAGKASLQKDAA